MYWLALHCFGLPLAVFDDRGPMPTVVSEYQGGHEWVVCASTAARAAGVRGGMTITAARIRAPALVALPRERAAEDILLQRLAEDALAYTDHVAPEPPCDLLLEIGRSADYFGGMAALLTAVDRLPTARAVEASRGAAVTPAAARLLARAGGGAIDPDADPVAALADYPAHWLATDSATAEQLNHWGMRRISDCWTLPRAGLRQRLGHGFVARLERITGERAETPPRFSAPEYFAARLTLADESDALERVVGVVEQLCRDLVDWLRRRDVAIQGFTLRLHALRGGVTTVPVGLAAAGRAEHEHLLSLARERLERTGVGGAIHTVELVSEPPMPYRPAVADLWADAGREPPERLLERLRARLGRRAIAGLTLRADHRPERAWDWSEPGIVPPVEPERLATRPLWLLTEPAPLTVDSQARPCWAGPLACLAGPERIESGWWDGNDIERDYFIARSRVGLVLWIYRERRPPRRWFVHGLFG